MQSLLASRERQQQTAKLHTISQSFVVRAFARDKGPNDVTTGSIKVSKIKRVKSVTLHPDVDFHKPEKEVSSTVSASPPVSSKQQDDTDELARNAVGKLQDFISIVRPQFFLTKPVQIFSSSGYWRVESCGTKKSLPY
jgi:hypothetical protein